MRARIGTSSASASTSGRVIQPHIWMINPFLERRDLERTSRRGENRRHASPSATERDDVGAVDHVHDPSPPSSSSIIGVPDLYLQVKDPRQSWNASSLAFLGDSVFELYARRRCFLPPKSAAKYRETVIQLVRAETQAIACGKLSESGILTEEEADVLRWGKNAPGTLPKRLERAVYRDATGLEALVGWLWVSGSHERLNTIMESIDML